MCVFKFNINYDSLFIALDTITGLFLKKGKFCLSLLNVFIHQYNIQESRTKKVNHTEDVEEVNREGVNRDYHS